VSWVSCHGTNVVSDETSSAPSRRRHDKMHTSGAVVVPLCGPCSTGTSGKKTGTATITPALMTAFKKHLLYVNVHTGKNPNGEIAASSPSANRLTH
jgi:hypothetical protein